MVRLTSDPNDVDIERGVDLESRPQSKVYLVLSDEERAKGFVRPVRQTYLHLRCNSTTKMSLKIAETYARNPHFYGATYCCNCSMHLPVGEDGEFVWENDGTKVGI